MSARFYKVVLPRNEILMLENINHYLLDKCVKCSGKTKTKIEL